MPPSSNPSSQFAGLVPPADGAPAAGHAIAAPPEVSPIPPDDYSVNLTVMDLGVPKTDPDYLAEPDAEPQEDPEWLEATQAPVDPVLPSVAPALAASTPEGQGNV
jgi:hypothetical protein